MPRKEELKRIIRKANEKAKDEENFARYELFIQIVEDPRNNNIPFQWKEKDEGDTYSDTTLEKAFKFAGRQELLQFKPDGILEMYYITDLQQGMEQEWNDSTSLSNKYGIKAVLKKGNSYFICKI